MLLINSLLIGLYDGYCFLVLFIYFTCPPVSLNKKTAECVTAPVWWDSGHLFGGNILLLD